VATGSEGEVEILMDDEVERLLFRMQERITNSQRDRLLVILLLYTGLRVSEAVSVRLKDIDFLTLQLKVFGKGGKFREVPLRNEVIEATREYMEGERKASRFSGSDFLFVSQRSSKLDRDTVNKILRRISGKVNIRLHPHIFRHTFCDRLLKKGVPITTVSRLAGHSSIQTTASYYINTSRKDKTEAVELL
jgi:integrase/recombinase XerD